MLAYLPKWFLSLGLSGGGRWGHLIGISWGNFIPLNPLGLDSEPQQVNKRLTKGNIKEKQLSADKRRSNLHFVRDV